MLFKHRIKVFERRFVETDFQVINNGVKRNNYYGVYMRVQWIPAAYYKTIEFVGRRKRFLYLYLKNVVRKTICSSRRVGGEWFVSDNYNIDNINLDVSRDGYAVINTCV